MTRIKRTLPEISLSGELFCPHCGKRLFSWDEGVIKKCPHLVFAYGWNEVNLFLAVRTDFAQVFMKELLKSPAYRKHLLSREMERIAEKDQKAFCRGTFSPQSSVVQVVAEHCWNFPEKMFPALLSASTVIFKDDRTYSGIHIAVDWGNIP